MVIDTSAMLAIFLAEAERTAFLDLILQAGKRLISAANVLETGIVLETRRGESAWRSFGKSRHPAALNFGDCFAYALARASGEPILAKGQNFALTDIELCTN